MKNSKQPTLIEALDVVKTSPAILAAISPVHIAEINEFLVFINSTFLRVAKLW